MDSATLLYVNWQLEHRKIIQLHIPLEEYEKATFWELYASYCRTMANLDIEYIRLIRYSLRNGPDVSRKKERRLSVFARDNDLLAAHARKLYFRKFRRVLSSSRAGELMQLDQTLRVVFRQRLWKGKNGLPLSEPGLTIRPADHSM